MNLDHQSTIVVDGASGYIGTHLVAALVKSGHKIHCLVRPGAATADTDLLTSIGAKVCILNLCDTSSSAMEAFAGATVAVHLIGSIAPKKGERLETLHGEMTKCLIKHCKQNHVPKVVMISALGAAQDALSLYHRTKWQAEEYLRHSGLNYVILRPSLVVGRTTGYKDSKLVRRLCNIIGSRKLVPLVAGGNNLIQPLFIDDLVQAIDLTVSLPIWDRQILEVGGPQAITMQDFVKQLMTQLNVHRQIINLPLPVASTVAWVCEHLQEVPLLSSDQLKLSCQNNICKDNALTNRLKLSLTPLSKALETYRLPHTLPGNYSFSDNPTL